ncbi:TRAP transporter substrate-binding protein DctP [Pseudooceanicola aestuarii]|uniref:TRAP transporter substrate-binding protein DctP n=1 Tax=Pseudooceanicola aestuarii TaxID=2697319 RepID=UPI001EF8A155|nr:TRAP transporter substrate-binding protein DctP [Pseudooceanicola aestuarii]
MTIEKTQVNRRALLRGAAVAAVATPALVGKGLAQGKVTWRVQSHWPKASSSFSGSLAVLAEQLDARTEGAFKLETFGAGEFAKGPDIFNIVRKGVVPMGSIAASYIQDHATTANFIYGIPGTFRASWEMQHAVKNLGLEDLINEELAEDGVLLMSEKVLPVEMVVSKKIESADDFRGLKIRSSGAMLDYLQSAGAAPQYIPGSELYQSLSSGVVDGAHWGAAVGAQSMSLWEVCKYHYKPALGQTTDSWIVNQSELDSLDDDLRQALLDLMEVRFFQRSAEYSHAEVIAISEGKANEGLEVMTLPDDVLQVLAEASTNIMNAEAEKGEYAAKAKDIYMSLMSDLGYV